VGASSEFVPLPLHEEALAEKQKKIAELERSCAEISREKVCLCRPFSSSHDDELSCVRTERSQR
jgi:hypothetical protein